MSLTDVQLLEETRLALDAVTTGGATSYNMNGQQVTKLDVPMLWEQVERLESRIGNSSGRNGMFAGSRIKGAR